MCFGSILLKGEEEKWSYCLLLKSMISSSSLASSSLTLKVQCRSPASSGHEITKNLSVKTMCTSSMNFPHRNRAFWRSSRGGWKEEKKEWETEWKWNMERVEGETVVSFQRETAKREKENTKSETPLFHLIHRNENLCRYQGGCFYSGVSIATVPICLFYRPQELLLCNMLWKKKCLKTVWLLGIMQGQTFISNSTFYVCSTSFHTQTHTHAYEEIWRCHDMFGTRPSSERARATHKEKKNPGMRNFNLLIYFIHLLFL